MALSATAQAYRRSLWADQGRARRGVGEKDAIRGTVYPVTAEYDVPLIIARGYSSETSCGKPRTILRRKASPRSIYQLGDHDRDGVRAWNAISGDCANLLTDDIE